MKIRGDGQNALSSIYRKEVPGWFPPVCIRKGDRIERISAGILSVRTDNKWRIECAASDNVCRNWICRIDKEIRFNTYCGFIRIMSLYL